MTSPHPSPAGGTGSTALADPPLLAIERLTLLLGGVQALREVELAVEPRTIVGLVGPNGAGKTSLFNCVCGYYPPTSGRVLLGGTDVTHHRPHRLATMGVARTFQHPVLQPETTVLDNVLVGGHTTVEAGPLSYTLRLPRARRAERALADRARDILRYLHVERLAPTLAGSLSYGGQKRVELARALMTEPRLLLLDELASGLAHEEVMDLAGVIRGIRDDLGVGILLVEHHMGMVSAVTDKVVVLVQGTKVAEGTAADVQRSPVVVEAYLGAAG